jgi:hypothetical protein
MKKERFYWAWIRKGCRTPDPESMTKYRGDLVRYYRRYGMQGRIVRVAVRVLS